MQPWHSIALRLRCQPERSGTERHQVPGDHEGAASSVLPITSDASLAQLLREATPYGLTPHFLIRDRDGKYGDEFTRVAGACSMEVLKTPYRASKANAICKRFLGSVMRECLEHLLVFGDKQLHRGTMEYVEYFNRARPHRGTGRGFLRDRTPASLAEAREAHLGSRPQWIAPRLPACFVRLGVPENLGRGFRPAQPPEQLRTRFSASTPIGPVVAGR
jgi:hypothetical protein